MFVVLSLSQRETCNKSATDVTECLFRRHFDALVVMGRGSDAIWYQAGSYDLSSGDRRIAASLTLCFFATLSILEMSLLRILLFVPFDATFHIWRKGFARACGIEPEVAARVID